VTLGAGVALLAVATGDSPVRPTNDRITCADVHH
jgi:hypothetical protein